MINQDFQDIFGGIFGNTFGGNNFNPRKIKIDDKNKKNRFRIQFLQIQI